ncbi:MAG: hypothetical protein GEU88_14565 [Solirubrobacterales bacterium]|nr:hypothetical protein [Solirubrobacterales bacterium]
MRLRTSAPPHASRSALALCLAALSIAGCGGEENQAPSPVDPLATVNQSRPAAVARAFVAAYARCGEAGAGLRAALLYPPRDPDAIAAAAADELIGPCVTEPESTLRVREIAARREILAVRVLGYRPCSPVPLALVRDGRRWWVAEIRARASRDRPPADLDRLLSTCE